ncbi:prolyl oligopeptidase [Phlyctochytrium arcticum]|nr:prolyl oligopeptidase [Phlyctochytrium arcticum]
MNTLRQRVFHLFPNPSRTPLLRLPLFRTASLSKVRTMTTAITYPTVRRDEASVEKIHGTEVKDPYRWLEDPDSEETKAFVDAQNQVFNDYIKKSPIREKFKEKLTKLWNYERFGTPFKRGDKYYYFHNSGLQAQSVLYQLDTLDGTPKTFLDPNKLSDDGTVSLNTYGFSESGKFFAYALSASGSDWVNIHIRETREGAPMNFEEKPLEWAKFTSIEWLHDDSGFFYNRYPKPVHTADAGTETDANKNAMLYYHKVGTPQEQDVMIFKPDDPDHIVHAEMSDDGKFLVMAIHRSCDPETKIHLLDIEKTFQKSDNIAANLQFTKVIDDFTAEFRYLTNEGRIFYFQTSLDAPRKRIVKYDLDHPEKGFIEVIPQSEDVLSESSVVAGDKLILIYLHDVKHVLRLHSLSSGEALNPKELPLPIGAIVGALTGKKDQQEIFYSFASFITPGMIYRFDFRTMTHSVFRETKVEGFKADDVETKQIFYSSKDGTKIPMYITSRKGLKLDGNNATLLYGYGGFNVPILPSFSVTWMTFVQHMNGVVAVANIRGGSEYGQDWHDAGRLRNKQNCFDDFQAAAKYLVAEKYTVPKKLAINGASNGGLLVGACLNQAPELFGCGIADVGVMDVTRFHKFTIGHAWTSDYGDPDKKEDFDVLYKYSPVHNVQAEKPYPAILITTGDHDDRVVPLHSHKLLATLQYKAKNNPQPILERIETKAGHGAGKSTQQRIEDATDKFAFIGLTIGTEWRD